MIRRVAERSAIAKIVAPDHELVRRFADNLNAIWPEGARPEGWTLGIAVSGGPDSMALLALAAAGCVGRVAAATVDHGLRPEAAAEAEMVARYCAHANIPHATLSVDVADGNVQAQARSARYHALAEWMRDAPITTLATAHHADDQAETLLMRLNRGSGAAGLAGVRSRGFVPGTRLPLLRPVLKWRRNVLAQFAADHELPLVQDPSNSDERFDRVQLRKALSATDWLDIDAISESATHLADASDAIEWAAAREWKECVTENGMGLVYRPKAPRAIALRVLTRIIAKLDGTEPRGSAVARVFSQLSAGQPASIGNLVARASYEGWTFVQAPRRRTS